MKLQLCVMAMIFAAGVAAAQGTAPTAPPAAVAPAAETPAAPAENSSAPVNAETAPAENTPADNTEAKSAPPTEAPMWQGSLLFAPWQTERLRGAMQLRRDSAAMKDLFGDSAQPAAVPIAVAAYPVFHLGSIIFDSPTEWFVWVNGKRILAAQARRDPDFQVIGISRGTARFAWKPTTTTLGENAWKRRELRVSIKGEDRLGDVTFDAANGLVEFSLKPNQTFYTENMQAVEGRVIPKELIPAPIIVPQNSTTNSPVVPGDATTQVNALNPQMQGGGGPVDNAAPVTPQPVMPAQTLPAPNASTPSRAVP